MTQIDKHLAALVAAIRSEARRDSRLETRVRTLETRVRQLTKQRDRHRGRCAELRGHIAKYQRELVQLRAEKRESIKALPWGVNK